MKKIKIPFLWIIIVTLLLISSYQTYALASIGSQLTENGISFGKSKVNYNFSTSSSSMGELPDMAGGC